MLCPVVVGRDHEVAGLVDRIAGRTARRGGVVVLVGEAGVGKTRLLTLAAESAGTVAFTGRAVPVESPVPYRPLTEAFLAALRGRPVPTDGALVGFEGQLARLVPLWRTASPADDSPLLLGESVARLLNVLSAERSSILVLEDLHWADPETLSVVEYLCDALPDSGGWCIATTRPDEATRRIIDRLERRRDGDVLQIETLDELGVERMAAACLGPPGTPAGLVEFLHRHSDGNPFLVEELLAGLIAAGVLGRVGEQWEIVGVLTVDIPASLRDSVVRRLGALDPVQRRVIGSAALLGRSFPWELLPGIAEVDGRTTVEALHAAVDAQLIESEGDGFLFRHALTREAIVADLLPPQRRELARRAWPAIERAHPGLPGPTCELAAELASAAGEPSAAAALLVESARRAWISGALATAEATARRARLLADDDSITQLDADEVLVHVLAAAGKLLEAFAVGETLDHRLLGAGVPGERRAELLVALARAAIVGGDHDAALSVAEEARIAAGPDASVALIAQIDATTAEVFLERVDLERAEALARRAIDGAEAAEAPDVLCEALLVLGRVQRPNGLADAHRSFQRAAEVAESAGLQHWHLRACQELAIMSWVTGDFAVLHSTRKLAARYGAHVTAAVMDLNLADVALSNFDRSGCIAAATACVDASRRYGLATEPVANLWLAGGHALGGDDEAMNAATQAALAKNPDDPRILADLYGRVLATRAFVNDQLDELPNLLDQTIVFVRRAPATTSVYPGRVLWALVHTIADDDLGAVARAEYDETTRSMGFALFGLMGEVMNAVALGRSGLPDEASATFDTAAARLAAVPGVGMVHSSMLLVSAAAIRDGWGDPVGWLRASEAWFAAHGYDRLVRRCRLMLGEAGAPIPRRGRGDSEVPTSLRALGVTSREVDVLKLVVEGRSNREIAAALHLSPKTVERHLSSLFVRTGVRNRHALAELGVGHLA